MQGKLMLVTTLILSLLAPAGSGAVELCAALDGSGSIIYDSDDFALQLEGLAAAVEDEAVIPRNGSVTVSVVLFGADAVEVVPPTVVDSPGSAAQLAADIRGVQPIWSSAFWHRTDLIDAIAACTGLFSNPSDEWIIDISTDGRDNTNDPAILLEARDGAVIAGLDVLNGIGIGEADIAALQDLAWPQPASSPPDKGFVISVPDFNAYVGAMEEKVRSEVQLQAAVDIKPRSCPNPLNLGKKGVLPAAVVGSADFDVWQVDPASVRLAGVEPLRWSYEDVTSPVDPGTPLDSCLACSESGPDGMTDLTLKFDAWAVAAALGNPADGECLLVEVSGTLKEEFGGRPFRGADVLLVIDR